MIKKIKEFVKSEPLLTGVFAAGLLLRLLYLFEYSRFINFDIACGADVREYFDRSMEILSGSFFPEKPDIHGMFYPMFSALVLFRSGSVVLLRVVQTLLNYASLWALFHLLGLYRVNDKVRKVFIILAAFYTVPVFHTAEIISESILIPLVTLLFYALRMARKREETATLYSAVSGVIGSFCILTHAGTGTLVFLLAADFLRRKLYKNALCFILPVMLVTGAVSAVKSMNYGKFVFVQSNGGFNFYLGNSPDSDGTCRIRPGLEWRRLHLAAQKEADEKNISTDRLFLQKSLEFTLSDPLSAASKYLIKAVKFFTPVELISGADPAEMIYRTFTVRSGLFTALFLWFSAAAGAVYAARKMHKELPSDFVILFLAVFITNVLTVTSGRYRLMVYPSLFLFAACSIVYLPRKVTAVFVIISVIFGAFANVSTPVGTAEMHRILGEAAYRKGDHDSAFNHLKKIEARNSDPSGVDNMLGGICEKAGAIPQAANYYRKAITSEPERFEAYMNLAQITPDKNTAEKLYMMALDREKNSGLLWINYAKFLLRNNRPQEACNAAAFGKDLTPSDPDAWNTYAVSCAYTGNLHAALNAFEKASRLDPSNPNYQRNANAIKSRIYRVK